MGTKQILLATSLAVTVCAAANFQAFGQTAGVASTGVRSHGLSG